MPVPFTRTVTPEFGTGHGLRGVPPPTVRLNINRINDVLGQPTCFPACSPTLSRPNRQSNFKRNSEPAQKLFSLARQWKLSAALTALSAGLCLAIARTQAGRAKRRRTNTLARGVLACTIGEACIRRGIRKSNLARISGGCSRQGRFTHQEKDRHAYCELHGDSPMWIIDSPIYARRRWDLLPSNFGFPIANSSIVRPVFSAATNQRGCLPRPDQVSDGSRGFWYFGKTRGYLRRSRPSP